MSTGGLERKEVIMTIFRVEVEVVEGAQLFCCQRSVRKMNPGFAQENECWVLSLYHLEKIVLISREALNIPSQILYKKRSIP